MSEKINLNYLRWDLEFFLLLLFRPLKMGTLNNHRRGLSEISYESPFSRDSNHIKKIPKKFSSVEKNRFEIFDFLSTFERIKRAIRITTA